MAQFDVLYAAWDKPIGDYGGGWPRYYFLNDGWIVLREREPGWGYEAWVDGEWTHYIPSERDLEILREITPPEAVFQAIGGASREKGLATP